MNVKTYSDKPVAGQPTAREAKAIAYYKHGLTDLTLNRNGIWVAYNAQLDLVRIADYRSC